MAAGKSLAAALVGAGVVAAAPAAELVEEPPAALPVAVLAELLGAGALPEAVVMLVGAAPVVSPLAVADDGAAAEDPGADKSTCRAIQ